MSTPPILKSDLEWTGAKSSENAGDDWLNMVKTLKVSEDDPGIVIEYASDDQIHQALAIAGSPIPQELSARLSAINFKNWVYDVIHRIQPQADVVDTNNVTSQSHFHNLDGVEYTNIQSALFHPAWVANCLADGAQVGKFYCVSAMDRGKLAITYCPIFP